MLKALVSLFLGLNTFVRFTSLKNHITSNQSKPPFTALFFTSIHNQTPHYATHCTTLQNICLHHTIQLSPKHHAKTYNPQHYATTYNPTPHYNIQSNTTPQHTTQHKTVIFYTKIHHHHATPLQQVLAHQFPC